MPPHRFPRTAAFEQANNEFLSFTRAHGVEPPERYMQVYELGQGARSEALIAIFATLEVLLDQRGPISKDDLSSHMLRALDRVRRDFERQLSAKGLLEMTPDPIPAGA